MEDRILKIERSRTLRAGAWVFSDQGESLIVTRPGMDNLTVGDEPVAPIVADLTRGYVTANQVATTVKGESSGAASILDQAAQLVHTKWDELLAAGVNIQAGIDGLANALSGIFNFGRPQEDANQAVADQAAATLALQNAVAALLANSSAGANGGKSYLYDFSSMPDSSSLPPEFTATFSGPGSRGYGISGGKATWLGANTDSRKVEYLHNAGDTDSDYQIVGGVFSTPPGADIDYQLFGVVYWSFSQHTLRGRENAAGDTFIEAEFGTVTSGWGTSLPGNTVLRLSCVVAGTRTVFKTETVNFKANTPYYLECGGGGGLRVYRVLEGAAMTPVLTHTEVGTTSQLGAGYRGGGGSSQHVHTTYVYGATVDQYATGSPLAGFLLRDNTTAAVVGSTGRAYRSSTSGVTTSGTPTTLSASTIDTVDYITDDLDYDPATNTFTVSKTRTYVVTLRIGVASPGLSTIQPVVYVNGTPRRSGGDFSGAASVSVTIPLQAGDTVAAGLNLIGGSPVDVIGDAGGTLTAFEILSIPPN
ncbi:hypothetical protein B1R94_02365 [Mycolicibacterium litorale]|nr:hypothetical protein B1R94_02365 [Mycolicibacterium litorale]